MDNLKDLIIKLSKNIMFRLSLCSKELFHSNYWALLLNEYPEIITEVFCENTKGCYAKNIKRESEHTDLSFQLNDELIIIENKFKSYPTIEQLQKYVKEQQKKDNNYNKIILVSFFEPHFLVHKNKINDFKIKYISYEELYKRLKKAGTALINKKDYPFFNSYLEMLEILITIKDYLSLKNKKYNAVYKEILSVEKEANEINFYSTIQKIFLNQLRCDLLRDKKIAKWVPFTNVDYASRAQEVFFDIMLNYENNEMGIRNIGITIVNDSNIRHYLGVNKNNRERLEIEDTLNKNLKWFFKECNGQKKDNIRFKGYDMKEQDKVWLYKTHNSKNVLDMNFVGIKNFILDEFKTIHKNLK